MNLDLACRTFHVDFIFKTLKYKKDCNYDNRSYSFFWKKIVSFFLYKDITQNKIACGYWVKLFAI